MRRAALHSYSDAMQILQRLACSGLVFLALMGRLAHADAQVQVQTQVQAQPQPQVQVQPQAQAQVQVQPQAEMSAEFDRQVRELALAATRSAAPDPNRAPPRVEVVVGALDPRLHLAPCLRIEPYLPPTTRLWGRARIGMRCLEGASRWNVYVPITVKVFGPALVARALLPVGSVVQAADLAQAEIDLAEEPSAALTDAAAVVGRTLARSIKPGQGVRAADLRSRQWFAAGATVQIRASGPGFSVAGEGQALTHGIEGEPVRVRLEGGRTVTGQAVGERRVELSL